MCCDTQSNVLWGKRTWQSLRKKSWNEKDDESSQRRIEEEKKENNLLPALRRRWMLKLEGGGRGEGERGDTLQMYLIIIRSVALLSYSSSSILSVCIVLLSLFFNLSLLFFFVLSREESDSRIIKDPFNPFLLLLLIAVWSGGLYTEEKSTTTTTKLSWKTSYSVPNAKCDIIMQCKCKRMDYAVALVCLFCVVIHTWRNQQTRKLFKKTNNILPYFSLLSGGNSFLFFLSLTRSWGSRHSYVRVACDSSSSSSSSTERCGWLSSSSSNQWTRTAVSQQDHIWQQQQQQQQTNKQLMEVDADVRSVTFPLWTCVAAVIRTRHAVAVCCSGRNSLMARPFLLVTRI